MARSRSVPENDTGQHAAARALRMVTASKLDLAFECLHWTAREDLPPDTSGVAAEAGSSHHELAESGASRVHKLDEHEEFVVQERFQGWLEKSRHLLPSNYREEVSYCIAPDGKVTRIGEKLGRDYGLHAGICGTIDVDGKDSAESEVIDYKTGKRLKPAKAAWQLRFASVVTGARRRSFHYVIESGETIPDSYDCTPAEREDDRVRLVVLMSDIVGGRTAPKPGDHCVSLYCPARKVCEAHKDHQLQKGKPMGRMGLQNIIKGKLDSPLSVLVYGTEGIGKSSFAAGAPSPIFLDVESGTKRLDVERFPKPETWADCIEALDMLANDSHGYRTVVTDTADALERFAHAEVCRRGNKKSIEDFGFGKGFTMAVDLAVEYMKKLEALHAKGMHIITLAHAHVKNFQNPAGENYDRFQLKMNEKFGAIFRELHDAVLFSNYQTFTVEKDGKVKAVGDGSRMLFTEHRPAWSAKNRYGLPFELPLDWAEFEKAAKAGTPVDPAVVKVEIDSLILQLAEADQKSASESKERCGDDVKKLALLQNWLKGKVRSAAPKTAETAAA